MSPARRILLNIVATYGRSLYALVVGLFCGRWALMALGQTDYGLMGLVGGLAAFISFLNGLMALAVGRFYALNVGKESVATDKTTALEESRAWFTTAVVLHTALPTALILAGYPAGLWAVRHFLEIPPDRIGDCVWVFRFVCMSTFVAMVCVPVQAMYTAKQYIAELTVYSFVTTTLNAVFLYYMVTHPGVWLAKYAFWTCVLAVAPQAIIAIRGIWLFPECRLRGTTGGVWRRMSELVRYACWLLIGCLGGLLRGQGIQVLLNKYYGPKVNAAMTVANHVNAHTQTLSMAMVGAFQPAIVSAYGAGDLEKMRMLAFRTCKLSMLFILLFVLPLSLELREVLLLWLKTPPQYVYGLCLCMFAASAIDQSTVGHMIAVNAKGKIAAYQAFVGGMLLLTLPLAWLFLAQGRGVYSVGVAFLVTTMVSAWGRVWFARNLVAMSARFWLRNVLAPVGGVTTLCLAVGWLPRLWMGPSVGRLFLTATTCETLFLCLVWWTVLSREERDYVKERLQRSLASLKKTGKG